MDLIRCHIYLKRNSIVLLVYKQESNFSSFFIILNVANYTWKDNLIIAL